MSVEEYLHTQFEDSDREYLDGEVAERNTGELPHAILQAQLAHRLLGLAETPTVSSGCGSSIPTSVAPCATRPPNRAGCSSKISAPPTRRLPFPSAICCQRSADG